MHEVGQLLLEPLLGLLVSASRCSKGKDEDLRDAPCRCPRSLTKVLPVPRDVERAHREAHRLKDTQA
eukprot:11437406-Alexandrium_andersonii.AAC.1